MQYGTMARGQPMDAMDAFAKFAKDRAGPYGSYILDRENGAIWSQDAEGGRYVLAEYTWSNSRGGYTLRTDKKTWSVFLATYSSLVKFSF